VLSVRARAVAPSRHALRARRVAMRRVRVWRLSAWDDAIRRRDRRRRE